MNFINPNRGKLPPGAILTAAAGNGSNAVINATLPAVAGKTNYLTGIQITGFGATAATGVTAGVTGVAGGLAFNIAVPAAPIGNIVPLLMQFDPPIPASAANVALILGVPAFGAGNTDVRVSLQGYLL